MSHPDKVNKDLVEEKWIEPIDVEESKELAIFFKMYADPTRLRILNLLFQSELCVRDIADTLEMTHSAVSHQLATLKQNRIVKTRRDKKNIFYSLDDKHIEMIYDSAYEHIKER